MGLRRLQVNVAQPFAMFHQADHEYELWIEATPGWDVWEFLWAPSLRIVWER